MSSFKFVATPCIDDHQLSPEDFESKGELSSEAARIVLKCLYLARMNRVDILWTVNALAREVTKWNLACDKRLHRLISYIHHHTDLVQHCWVGDAPDFCQLALFCDASFAGDLRDSKSTSGCYLCLIGPRTFVPITWFCKKQGAVSHSSSEAEVISLEAAVRMEGLPALMLWELVQDVYAKRKPQVVKPGEIPSPELDPMVRFLSNVDYVPPTVPISSGRCKLI